MWFTDADVKDFKSGALRTTTNTTRAEFELSVIAIAKCNLFFHYCDSKEISFYYFRDTKLVQDTKKHVNSIYIVGIMFFR